MIHKAVYLLNLLLGAFKKVSYMLRKKLLKCEPMRNSSFLGLLGVTLKCGEWTYLFATIVANVKILLDIN